MDNKNTDVSSSEPKVEQTAVQTPVADNAMDSEHSRSSTDHATKEAGTRFPWGIIVTLIIVILLAFASAAGGYYLYQELTAQKVRSAALNQQLQTALKSPTQRIASLEQQQTQLSASFEQQLARIGEEQNQLQERVAVIAQRNPNHWRAEEAKYLVILASRKLWLEKDPSTATSLLKAADERIKSMKDPSLTPLRKALSKDIAAVAAIKNPDISGTVLTLDGIIEHIHELPLNRAETHFSADELKDTQMSDSLDDWQSNLAKSWKALMDDFVIVRKRTTDAAPLLDPDQQWYLVENTKNKLLQAQLALFRQDQVNYRNSVVLARKWIFQYFDLKDPKTTATLAALDALATLKIQTVTIDRFESSAMLIQLVTYGNLMTTEEAQ